MEVAHLHDKLPVTQAAKLNNHWETAMKGERVESDKLPTQALLHDDNMLDSIRDGHWP